ncbi:hypothetical protein COY27_00770 [Candidatus Woesearchaeota archaeon CG_4_10_14_0_2_um_filter_33_13]|nr:MAG: hypothetical protein COY27_00770 [Candidatus Woesearchaeota archaeon CG_4_10_14_0_2_um_filter_33_13]
MSRNKLDHIVQLFIPPSLVVLMFLTILELFYELSVFTKFVIDIFDLYVIIIFAIDLYYRWQDTPYFWLYLKKHWLDIIATIPFNLIFIGVEGLALIQGLRGIRNIKGLILAIRTTKSLRFVRFIKVIRFSSRLPRFLRAREHLKETKIRKVQPHEKEMKGTLSFKVILLITINSIMGTGIYFLTAAGAKYSGPASLISWGILSLISIYIAMCFSELASMFPKAGGVYEFAKQAYGRFFSFIVGWATSIAGSVTIAMLLLGSLQYLLPNNPQYYIPVAFLLIIVFNLVAYRGLKTSTFMLVTFAIFTLVTVIGLIFPGLLNLNPQNFQPFFVFPSFTIILTIFFIAETFFGWESAVFLSAETKNPTKVMPKALIYGTIIIAVLAFALALSAMGIIPWQEYAQSNAPLRDLSNALFGNTGGIVFTALIFISIIGAVACWVVSAPRLLMSIAEDKLFFVQFSKIHPKYKSPYVSIGFQSILLMILVWIGSGSYETLLHILLPLIIFVYSAVLLSLVVLRFKKPQILRPYKVIFGKVGPLITILFMGFLLVMFLLETKSSLSLLKVSLSLVLFGVPAYFFIEIFYEANYITLRRDIFAKLRKHWHKMPHHRSIYSTLIKHSGLIRNNAIILDHNSPVGIIGHYLLKRKIPFSKLLVVNSSNEEISLIKKRTRSKRVFLHKSKPGQFANNLSQVDVLYSYNVLGYVKMMDNYVRDICSKLKTGGTLSLVVYNHWFNVMPNTPELEKIDKIKKMFLDNKVDVKSYHHKSFWKEEFYFYGTKK